MGKYYTGVGARQTPGDVLAFMEKVGGWLARHNWVLRSGGAAGADSAFEKGAESEGASSDIYLPWPKFKGHTSPLAHPSDDAMQVACKLHPAWGRCSQGARKLHARNVHQLVGDVVAKPVPSQFLVCWTPGGATIGGTGMAIRLAEKFNVPVFNLANEGEGLRLRALINNLGE